MKMPITYKLVIPSEGQSNRMEQPSDMGLLIQKVMEGPWQHPKRTLKAQFEEHDKQIDKKVTQEGQNTKDYVRKVLTNTSFKYLGISDSCSRTTTFFGSFRIHFSAQSF